MAITSLFNSLSSGSYGLKVGGFNVSLPSLSVTNSSIETPGIGGFVGSAGSIVQAVTNGAGAIFCIGSLLTNPSSLLNVISSSLVYLGEIAVTLMADIYKTCVARIDNILSQVYGIVQSYFKTVLNVINCIKGIGALIQNLIDFWKNRGDLKILDYFKKLNCEFMIANLTRCMMDKLLEPYIEKFKLKANQEINDIAGDITKDIDETTAPLSSMSNYLNQQTMFVNKFVTQVNNVL